MGLTCLCLDGQVVVLPLLVFQLPSQSLPILFQRAKQLVVSVVVSVSVAVAVAVAVDLLFRISTIVATKKICVSKNALPNYSATKADDKQVCI